MNKPSLFVWLPGVVFGYFGLLVYWLLAFLPGGQRFGVATALIGTLVHLVAAAYFIVGLRNFRKVLRAAYLRVSLGIATFGIANSQLTVVNLFGWWFWTKSGAVIIPYLVSVLLIFVGTRRFAKELKLGGRWFSLALATTIALGIGIIFGILPHAPNSEPELTHRVATALEITGSIFLIFICKGILIIRNKAGAGYTNSLAWFSTALIFAVIGGLQYGLALVFIPGNNWYFDYHLTNLFFTTSGWLFMRAGYAFCVIGSPAPTAYPKALRKFFGAGQRSVKDGAVTSLDVIVYAADMASSPFEIDPILDDFRTFTARIHSPSALSEKDQTSLAGIYRRLEDYLVKDEKLRQFTRPTIRQSIQAEFNYQSLSHTFWPLISNG